MLEDLNLNIPEEEVSSLPEEGFNYKEKLLAKQFNALLRVTSKNFKEFIKLFGADLEKIIFENKSILDSIKKSGSGEIITKEEREKLLFLKNYTHPSNHPASMITFDNTGTGLISDNVDEAIRELFDDIISLPGFTGLEMLYFGKISIAGGLPDVTTEERNVYYIATDSGVLTIDGTDHKVKKNAKIIYYGSADTPFWDIDYKFGEEEEARITAIEQEILNDIVFNELFNPNDGLPTVNLSLGNQYWLANIKGDLEVPGTGIVTFNPNDKLIYKSSDSSWYAITVGQDGYTKAEIDDLLAGKLSTIGGTLEGDLRINGDLRATGNTISFLTSSKKRGVPKNNKKIAAQDLIVDFTNKLNVAKDKGYEELITRYQKNIEFLEGEINKGVVSNG